MLKRAMLCLAMLAAAAGSVVAQNPEPPKPPEPAHYYKLEFVVKEVEGGKVVNARSYMTSIATGNEIASIRTGSKLVVEPAPGQMQYLDVGVSLDCQNARELQGALALYVRADISSVSGPASPKPVIRQNKWNAAAVVPINKPTLLFSSDDVASKGQMQVELTATPIK